jgi:hypothetical protein
LYYQAIAKIFEPKLAISQRRERSLASNGIDAPGIGLQQAMHSM